MRFGSVCSGIEAASVAWHPLGWQAAWLSEIEPFPSAVLKHHYPDVPNLGDMTQLPDRIASGEVEAPDLFCGGTPCQAFSVAGLRKSLDDARGNLSLVFCEIANAIDNVRTARGKQPCIVFWENVPGVLNTKDNAFGCFLAGVAGEGLPLLPPGGRWTNAGCVHGPQRTVAWRILDAQYFGVAQRRRRVFVVASARNDFNPVKVLFEFEGMRRDIAPSREARQAAAASAASGASKRGWPADISSTLDTTFGTKQGLEDQHVNAGCPMFVPASYGIRTANTSSNGWGIQEEVTHTLDTAQGVAVAQPMVVHGTQDPCVSDIAFAQGRNNGGENVLAQPIPLDLRNAGRDPEKHDEQNRQGVGVGEAGDAAHTLTTACVHGVASGMAVRRLTPVECERLQGFPDGYTNIPWRKASEAPDGPRYKALGNSWAVPVVNWIGRRIQACL